jgi:two-component system, NtrC family, nitrogen regulation sensor histidine kinase NtrY
MTLRRRFVIFAVLIHALLLGLSLPLLDINEYYFLAAEGLILLSIAVTIALYLSFLKPLHLMTAGIESIKDRDFSTKFVASGSGEVQRLIDVYNQMIDQLRAERVKQQEQHYFLERLINATPMGVIVLDLDEHISMINPAAVTLLGVQPEDAIGTPLRAMGEPLGELLANLANGDAQVVSVNGVQSFRSSRSHFLDRGFTRHFILVEELTREILSTQKRAYEKVIRMMSHEVNNSVGAINSILQSLLNYAPQLAAEDRADFEEATRVAIDRNEGLNRFMANFATVVRTPQPLRAPYDLHELLKSVHMLMSVECRNRNVVWRWELAPSPFIVAIDTQQMQQVLVNIVKNAIEAIGSDGTITVCTSGSPAKSLRIIDTGKGIAAEARQHLFTPFYSTKKDGQGIGLTLTKEILVNHGFNFNLEPTADGHTEFSIEFSDQR